MFIFTFFCCRMDTIFHTIQSANINLNCYSSLYIYKEKNILTLQTFALSFFFIIFAEKYLLYK